MPRVACGADPPRERLTQMTSTTRVISPVRPPPNEPRTIMGLFDAYYSMICPMTSTRPDAEKLGATERIVITLQALGHLERTNAGLFPGTKALYWIFNFLCMHAPAEGTTPLPHELRKAVGEWINLSLLDGRASSILFGFRAGWRASTR